MALRNVLEYIHFKKSIVSIILNAKWRKQFLSSTLTCNPEYFRQVYQSKTPLQDLIVILNILELLKLVIEVVANKDAGVEEDASEEVDLGMAYKEEEGVVNMTPTLWQENMDTSL